MSYTCSWVDVKNLRVARQPHDVVEVLQLLLFDFLLVELELDFTTNVEKEGRSWLNQSGDSDLYDVENFWVLLKVHQNIAFPMAFWS